LKTIYRSNKFKAKGKGTKPVQVIVTRQRRLFFFVEFSVKILTYWKKDQVETQHIYSTSSFTKVINKYEKTMKAVGVHNMSW